MASVLKGGELIIKLENGLTSTGRARVRTLSFDIKPNSTDEDILAIGSALSNLQSKNLIGIYKTQTYEVN
ncbi:DUF1659 domain-containing protein [Caldicellulosiruptoraceae bacterium PP1]